MEVIAACESRNVDGKIRGAEDLGVVIRKRRIKLGLAWVQLAEVRRCSPRFVGELERGVAGGNVKQVIPACKMPEIDLFAKARGEQLVGWLVLLSDDFCGCLGGFFSVFCDERNRSRQA